MAHLACRSCIHIPTYCPCRDAFIHEWMVKRFTNNLVGGFCFQIIPTILYSQFGSLWQIMRVEHNPCSRQPTRSTFTHTHTWKVLTKHTNTYQPYHVLTPAYINGMRAQCDLTPKTPSDIKWHSWRLLLALQSWPMVETLQHINVFYLLARFSTSPCRKVAVAHLCTSM